jgi:hypothetical protein
VEVEMNERMFGRPPAPVAEGSAAEGSPTTAELLAAEAPCRTADELAVGTPLFTTDTLGYRTIQNTAPAAHKKRTAAMSHNFPDPEFKFLRSSIHYILDRKKIFVFINGCR